MAILGVLLVTDWPISPAIEFNQGYGETWSVRNTW